MGDLDLDKLAELLAVATPGPWRTIGDAPTPFPGDIIIADADACVIAHAAHGTVAASAAANADAIVALWSAAPTLLAAAREREEAHDTLKALGANCPRPASLSERIVALARPMAIIEAERDAYRQAGIEVVHKLTAAEVERDALREKARELREKARALPRCEANRDVSGPERCGKIATHRASYRDLPVCDAHALPRDVVIEGVAAIRALAALLEEPADGE